MSKKPNIGVVMDPIAHIKPEKDSTLAMMLGAQSLGAHLFYMEPDDLYIKDDTPYGIMCPLQVYDDPAHWFSLETPRHQKLADLDIILMRKDPPVDKRFIHTCYMLEHAARQGVRVINSPLSLTAYNEKFWPHTSPTFARPMS